MNFTQLRPVVIGEESGRSACADCDARGVSVCNAIDDDDLGRLAATAVHRSLEKSRIFIEEGEKATDFFNITAGTVKLFKLLPDGRQQITGFAGPGHFLGLAVADTYAFSAETIEPVRLCRFSRAKLHTLMHDFPALEARLLQTACNELATAQEQMLMLGRKTARERVASFLLSRANAAQPCGHPQNEIHLPMTRGEIADYLGLTIETVSRVLSRFRAENHITLLATDHIRLTHRDWLESLAAGNLEHA